MCIAETKTSKNAYTSIMELYFKDLEDDTDAMATGFQCASDGYTVTCANAEEDAFAELSERVSAARLVY